jgi:arsenate reductase-like glutaredoxin family protein
VRDLVPDIEQRDYAKKPLTEPEIVEIVGLVGSVATALNTRHAIAKERGWKESPPTVAAFAKAAAADNNLLRRPIVIRDGKAVVGFDEAAIRALVG